MSARSRLLPLPAVVYWRRRYLRLAAEIRRDRLLEHRAGIARGPASGRRGVVSARAAEASINALLAENQALHTRLDRLRAMLGDIG